MDLYRINKIWDLLFEVLLVLNVIKVSLFGVVLVELWKVIFFVLVWEWIKVYRGGFKEIKWCESNI